MSINRKHAPLPCPRSRRRADPFLRQAVDMDFTLFHKLVHGGEGDSAAIVRRPAGAQSVAP